MQVVCALLLQILHRGLVHAHLVFVKVAVHRAHPLLNIPPVLISGCQTVNRHSHLLKLLVSVLLDSIDSEIVGDALISIRLQAEFLHFFEVGLRLTQGSLPCNSFRICFQKQFLYLFNFV